MGPDEKDDILSCVHFLLVDVMSARRLLSGLENVTERTDMAFLSDIFSRVGRVARGQANQGVGALEDATFEATVKQTVADMRTELNKVVRPPPWP